jgi:hypothetical protein
MITNDPTAASPIAVRMFCVAFLCVIAVALSPVHAADNPLNLRMYSQDFTIDYASPADAQRATLTPTPVLDGKRWAFSARWDDNNPLHIKMHQLMVANGLRGTFYLNASADLHHNKPFGPNYARGLMTDGFTIGGHTQTHAMLTALSANEMFYEVLANRVQRESDINYPMNSFAFPFGQFVTKGDPEVEAVVTDVILRSGFHNTPYRDFVTANPSLSPHEISTSTQVIPGDHVVDPVAFDKQMSRLERIRDQTIRISYCLNLGVHVRQSGAGWDQLNSIFAKYAHNPDWWYCNMNQFAAYDRQFHNSELETLDTQGATRRYRITRPIPAELGDDVPLTFALNDVQIAAVHGDGVDIQKVESGGHVFIDVGHVAAEPLPSKINAIDNSDNSEQPPAAAKLKDFPGFLAWLSRDTDNQTLKLSLHNSGDSSLAHLRLTLRLPPQFKDGLRRIDLSDLPAGAERTESFPLGEQRASPAYLGGRPYLVAELDFHNGPDVGRVFATDLLPASPDSSASLRDSARYFGPLANPQQIDLAALLPTSIAGAPLTDPGSTPDLKWFASTATADYQRYNTERLMLYADDAPWRTTATKLDFKPQTYGVVVDFNLSQQSEVRILTEAKVNAVLLNGKRLDSTDVMTSPVAGSNRAILILTVNDNRGAFKSQPVFLRLSPASGELQYKPPPQ